MSEINPNKSIEIKAPGVVGNIDYENLKTRGEIWKNLTDLEEKFKGATFEDYDAAFEPFKGERLKEVELVLAKILENIERINKE